METNDKESKKSAMNRRDFLQMGLRGAALVGLAGVSGYLIHKSTDDKLVWQIDPYKCQQCGRCATECVLNPSAVKAVHAYKMCGYCNFCSGYFIPNVKDFGTAAEKELCPTKAIQRTFIEEPYYKYDIKEDLCIGCAKCVKGCGAFGNGSFHLQIRHDVCVNCNQCNIAKACPAGAFVRLPAKDAYLLKNGWKKG
jgi:Na+-translocating ferredoxin:NAD+ oxidoreductase subunit B